MKKQFFVAIAAMVFACLLTTATSADTLFTNTGGPFKVTAKFGGTAKATVTAPDWIEMKEESSNFDNGWQVVTVNSLIKPTDEPRSGEVVITFDTGTTHRFKVRQAGTLRLQNKGDTLTTQIPVELVASAQFLPYDGDPIPVNIKKMKPPKQRGWLFVTTKSGNVYSAWHS